MIDNFAQNPQKLHTSEIYTKYETFTHILKLQNVKKLHTFYIYTKSEKNTQSEMCTKMRKCTHSEIYTQSDEIYTQNAINLHLHTHA